MRFAWKTSFRTPHTSHGTSNRVSVVELLRCALRLRIDASFRSWTDAKSEGGMTGAGKDPSKRREAWMERGGTKTLLRNRFNGSELLVVGTAHVSESSAEEVRRSIREFHPETVMVELCDERAKRMKEKEKNQGSFFLDSWKAFMGSGSFGSKALQVGLGLFYRYCRSLGMMPGQEMMVAMMEAKRAGSKLVCGDRDIHVTLERLQEVSTPMDVFKLLGPRSLPEEVRGMLEGVRDLETAVERMKNRKAVRAMVESMRKRHPSIVRVLLDERDVHMARILHGLEGRTLAVVGLAHLDGIEKAWKEMQGEEDREDRSPG